MKKNTLALIALALLLVALIAGCRRAKHAVVSEVQATPTTAATAVTGRTVVPVTSPTPTSEGTPEITPTPTVEAATPTPTTAGEATPTTTPTSTSVPTTAPTAAPTAAPTEAPTTTPGEQIHTVQPGENLFRIALHYDMTYQALAAANGIVNPDLILVGQRLTIPAEGTAEPTGERTHVVQPGENLFRIALKYGVTVEAIAVANDISNVHLIYPGQELVIP
ncbi:MAG: LysM peptidoglycan-binding domain-containing protein [Anaerolineae bacterium]